MAALFLNAALRKRIDRVPALQRARWRMEAGLLALFWWFCARLEPDTASAFGQRLFRRIGPSLGKAAQVQRNLRVAFPDLSEAERADLLREVWGNAGAVLAEYPHFKAICHDDFAGHFEVLEKWDVAGNRAAGRHGIFVTAHVGNWELPGAAAGHHGFPITVIYAPSRNPFIDRMLRRRREALGCRLVSLEEGARHLLRELTEGRSVGLVVDLVPARVERVGPARFRLIVHEPIRPDPALASDKDRAIQMMRDLNRLFEQWIRERPEQWLCIKRAWPKSLEAQASCGASAPANVSAEA
jgi:KDO2-lipid IV(A) lauroyltransferase